MPYRHSDRGWFDYNPLLRVGTGGDLALQQRPGGPAPAGGPARARPDTTGATVRPFRSKEEAGHEEPWFAFLAGDNPRYPEKILAAAQAQVRHRLARGRRTGTSTSSEADIHVWQQCNPVVTEALVQLTWGGPQVLYNGGLQQARVRYYDAEPAPPRPAAGSVAALVSSIDPAATVVDLVNLTPSSSER